jgi:hypothetical protein
VRLEAEFTSEPFHGEGSPPEHALAARDAAAEAGLDTDFGPLGTLARGEAATLLAALPAIAQAALDGGATLITLQVRRSGTTEAGEVAGQETGPAATAKTQPQEPAGRGEHQLGGPTGKAKPRAGEPAKAAGHPVTGPIAEGAPLVEPDTERAPAAEPGAGSASAEPNTEGGPVELNDALARLIADVERELGAGLGELDRSGKQRAVRLLRERGAFGLRKSVSSVADALGVTRFTVYNYLNREAD